MSALAASLQSTTAALGCEAAFSSSSPPVVYNKADDNPRTLSVDDAIGDGNRLGVMILLHDSLMLCVLSQAAVRCFVSYSLCFFLCSLAAAYDCRLLSCTTNKRAPRLGSSSCSGS